MGKHTVQREKRLSSYAVVELGSTIYIRVNERDRKLPSADGVTIATDQGSELRQVSAQKDSF